MQDINARIIVAVESAKAEQQAGRVQNGIKGITDARMKDLQVARAKTKAELAEYKSLIAAQKAYAAEQQLAGAEAIKRIRQRRGADPEEMKLRTERIEQYRGKVLKLQDAEAAANLQAYQAKKNYDQLASGVSKASKASSNLKKSTQGLTGTQIAARAAGRILGIELNATSTAMLAGTAAVGGLTLAAGALAKMISYANNAHARYRKELSQHEALHKTVSQGVRDRIAAERSDIETIGEYGDKTDLTKKQSLLLSDAMKRLSGRFRDLGIDIHSSTGEMKSFIKIAAQLKEAARQDEIKMLQRDLEIAEQELGLVRYKERTTGIAVNPANLKSKYDATIAEWIRRGALDNIVEFFGGNSALYRLAAGIFEARGRAQETDRIRVGGDEASARLDVLNAEAKVNNIRNKIKRLENQTPFTAIADAEEKDAIKARELQLSELDKQIKIQQLLQQGRKREAEILRIDMELARERRRLTGAELQAFDKTYALERQKRIALYDERQKQRIVNKNGAREIFGDMYSAFNQYRSSVQEAVLGGSDEEFYMKNRYMMNTDVSPMQKAADGITALKTMGERMNRTLEELDRKLATLNTSSSETARALSNGKIYA